MKASGQLVSRDANKIRLSDGDYIVFALAKSGLNTISQDGHDATIRPNEFAIYDTTRPFKLHFPMDFEQVIIKIPRKMLIERVGPARELMAFAFNAKRSLSKLVFDFALNIQPVLEKSDPATVQNLLVQAVDLLSMDIGERLYDCNRSDTQHKSALRYRLKSFIRSHLRNPDLSLVLAATSLSITPRYINALLAEEGTSFGRHLLSERLDKCRADLCDKSKFQQQISDIAYNWGFKDSAHFSRAFKAKFGLTPRECRHISMMRIVENSGNFPDRD